MPKINIFLMQSLISNDLQLKDKNVIMIDVLRATTTINIALNNGAKEVIPAENVLKAAKIKRGSANALLCGERGGKKIVGFDLGNSPLEYKPDLIKNKTLIFSTTNGTNAIVKARLAKDCVLASFNNIQAIVDYILDLNQDFEIVCSGKNNNFCMEDFVCAGNIIKELLDKKPANVQYELSDVENAALQLADRNVYINNKVDSGKILDMLKSTEHGKFLMTLGFEEDLVECSKFNSLLKIPIYAKEVIKLKEQIELENYQRQQMKKININGEKDNS